MKLTREEACAILGVEDGADEQDIKTSFKKLALKWHPDKNNNSAESNEKMKEISAAYTRLTAQEDDSDDELDDDDMFSYMEEIFFELFARRSFFDDLFGSRRGSRATGGYSRRGFSYPAYDGPCNCPRCQAERGARTRYSYSEPEYVNPAAQKERQQINRETEVRQQYVKSKKAKPVLIDQGETWLAVGITTGYEIGGSSEMPRGVVWEVALKRQGTKLYPKKGQGPDKGTQIASLDKLQPGTAYCVKVRLGISGAYTWSGEAEFQDWGPEEVFSTDEPPPPPPKPAKQPAQGKPKAAKQPEPAPASEDDEEEPVGDSSEEDKAPSREGPLDVQEELIQEILRSQAVAQSKGSKASSTAKAAGPKKPVKAGSAPTVSKPSPDTQSSASASTTSPDFSVRGSSSSNGSSNIMQAASDSYDNSRGAEPPEYKKGLVDCRHWMKGTCTYGDKCWFKHDPAKRAAGTQQPAYSKPYAMPQSTAYRPSAPARPSVRMGSTAGVPRPITEEYLREQEEAMLQRAIQESLKYADSYNSPTVDVLESPPVSPSPPSEPSPGPQAPATQPAPPPPSAKPQTPPAKPITPAVPTPARAAIPSPPPPKSAPPPAQPSQSQSPAQPSPMQPEVQAPGVGVKMDFATFMANVSTQIRPPSAQEAAAAQAPTVTPAVQPHANLPAAVHVQQPQHVQYAPHQPHAAYAGTYNAPTPSYGQAPYVHPVYQNGTGHAYQYAYAYQHPYASAQPHAQVYGQNSSSPYTMPAPQPTYAPQPPAPGTYSFTLPHQTASSAPPGLRPPPSAVPQYYGQAPTAPAGMPPPSAQTHTPAAPQTVPNSAPQPSVPGTPGVPPSTAPSGPTKQPSVQSAYTAHDSAYGSTTQHTSAPVHTSGPATARPAAVTQPTCAAAPASEPQVQPSMPSPTTQAAAAAATAAVDGLPNPGASPYGPLPTPGFTKEQIQDFYKQGQSPAQSTRKAPPPMVFTSDTPVPPNSALAKAKELYLKKMEQLKLQGK